MRRIHRIIHNVDLCRPGFPLQESPAVLDEECCKLIIQQIDQCKRLGFFEPQIDETLPSYEGVRPYDQAAFVVHAGWLMNGVLRIAVEPMKTKAGGYFWNALRANRLSFAPLFYGTPEPGTLRIQPDSLQYLCTDAFLVP